MLRKWLRIGQLRAEALEPQLCPTPLRLQEIRSALWPQFCHLQHGHNLDFAQGPFFSEVL